MLALGMLAGCGTPQQSQVPATPEHEPARGVAVRITRWDADFDAHVARDVQAEQLAEGFTWAEGPAWLPREDALLFTDVPRNRLYRWSARDGLRVLLEPSGYAGPPTAQLREPGANGLHVTPDGQVLLADSGSRQLVALDPATRRRTVLASRFDGRRFNSPNDLVRRDDGRVFFTDPPYGLTGMQASPARELAFSGVYRVDPDGTVRLLDAALRFPNGIALSPDQRTLYVANSDPAQPLWIAYTLDAAGDVTARRVFADASDLVTDDTPGLPDGLAVADDGTLFATGPVGVIVFAPDGRRLGRIEVDTPVANVGFGDDGRSLYLTAQHRLLRLRVLSGAVAR